MRKRVVIISVIAAVILLVGAGSGLIIHRNNQEQARQVTAAAQAKKLSDWQNKVKAWNAEQMQKEQTSSTAASTSLQKQGVDQLPKTGISTMTALLGVIAAIVGYVLNVARLRRTAEV